MRTKPRGEADRLAWRGWLLWGVTFTLVFALTATVTLLVMRLGEQARAEGAPAESYSALIGLIGMVVIFSLYTGLKQRELNTMRNALRREEHELDGSRLRLSELSALFQTTTTLNLYLRLDMILEIIVRRVVSVLRAQQASIMIYNPETGMLETRASYGLESEYARNASRRIGEGIAGRVAERGRSMLLGANAPDDELVRPYKQDRPITSALSMPLRVGERCVGVLNVNRIQHPEPFQEHHRDMLDMFAEHVGAVVERAETMDRLGSKSRALEADNLRLAELNQMKDVFLSTASHELKTPLTSVIAYAELLDENETSLDKKQRAEFLRRLRAEAERLLSLIEDILDLSRLESGKLTLKRAPLTLTEVARAAIETTRSMAGKHDVQVTEQLTADLPAVLIDEVKMRQVVVNLIVNAVKFSPARGQVTVRTGREPGFLLLEVQDRGPGIAPEQATHIFELFGQGVPPEAGEEKAVGLGIGLHLVKRITELHGGHVGVHSVPGSGSTFWVRLPIALADLAAPSLVDDESKPVPGRVSAAA